jgi:hypothetical protein
MASTERRVWTQPKLKILVRGKPEENVLIACKHAGLNGPIRPGCLVEDEELPCSVVASS